MKKDKTFKVGNKIIHFDQVYRIFKISGKKNEDKVIFFKRYFKTKRQRELIFSIPLSNIDETRVRMPISKKELKGLLKKLGQKSETKTIINTARREELLGSNDPDKNVDILKELWSEKKRDPERFNKTKENLLKLVIEKMSEEVAIIHNISLVKAVKKIKKALVK